jgi:hypothetical protein
LLISQYLQASHQFERYRVSELVVNRNHRINILDALQEEIPLANYVQITTRRNVCFINIQTTIKHWVYTDAAQKNVSKKIIELHIVKEKLS